MAFLYLLVPGTPPACSFNHLFSVLMESGQSVNYTECSHHFNFNYSRVKDLCADQFVSSPVFHASSHDWVIDCYPYGLSKGPWSIDFMFFLVRIQGECNNNVDPTFRCSLITRNRIVCRFEPEVLVGVGVYQLIEITLPNGDAFISLNLLEKTFVNNGSFELICSISDVDTEINNQIAKLWESREMGDVTFNVENCSFTCHRLILAARSNVFKAELFGNMAEVTQKCINIKCMSSDVFEAMLHFMYTDLFPSSSSEKERTEMAKHLFEAADRYAMDGLKALCENHLRASMSLGTVAKSLVLAEQHNSPRLKNSCLEFLAEPGTLISWTLTTEYVELVRSFPSKMAEIRAKVDTAPFLKRIQVRKI